VSEKEIIFNTDPNDEINQVRNMKYIDRKA